jgi:ABC-type nickel/cobalt efflux system permease component RcnA
MGLLIFVLIVLLLAAAGVLGFVVKVAVGVALGMVAGLVLAAWFVRRRVRRLLWGNTRPPESRWRRISGSSVEVLDPRDDA